MVLSRPNWAIVAGELSERQLRQGGTRYVFDRSWRLMPARVPTWNSAILLAMSRALRRLPEDFNYNLPAGLNTAFVRSQSNLAICLNQRMKRKRLWAILTGRTIILCIQSLWMLASKPNPACSHYPPRFHLQRNRHSGSYVFLATPFFGPLLFENTDSDCRDHCANERSMLWWCPLYLSTLWSFCSLFVLSPALYIYGYCVNSHYGLIPSQESAKCAWTADGLATRPYLLGSVLGLPRSWFW